MKTILGHIEVVKIDQIKEVEEFKKFYEIQRKEAEDQLKCSLKNEGQLSPVIVTKDYILIDGYRRLNLLRELGCNQITVQVTDIEPTIDLRVTYNTQRQKTDADLTKEVIQVFVSVPKLQGQRNIGGSYNRYEIIQKKLDYRWKSSTAIRQIDKIIENDFDNNLLINGIVTKGWSLKDCERYIDELKDIDLKNKYGFTDQLKNGSLNISQVNKFIHEKDSLEKDYQDTFVIPKRVNSFNKNCTDIKNEIEFHAEVDTIMTSIPYWKLRKYDNEDGDNQLGKEKTPEEFAAKIGEIFAEFEITLKISSNVFVNIGETYVDGCAMDVPGLVKRAILDKTNLKLKDVLIWSKPNPKPQSEKVRRPINKTEYILWFVVDPKEAKYNMVTYTDSSKESKITNGAKDVNENGVVSKKVKSLSKHYKKIYNHISQQEVENIIICAVGKNIPISKAYSQSHPAAMSELLPIIPIMMTTDENDLVYDPFGGANTTGRITNLLNRRYLSTELSSHYHKIGCRVMENTQDEINLRDLEVITNKFIKAA